MDSLGHQLDEGRYGPPNDHTVVFLRPRRGARITAHFRISDDLNTVKFDLVVPDDLRQC